jgi:hypothetical protein
MNFGRQFWTASGNTAIPCMASATVLESVSTAEAVLEIRFET